MALVTENYAALPGDDVAAAEQGFVTKVYGILSAQLVVTIMVAAPIYSMGQEWLHTHVWVLLASWVCLFSIVCCRQSMRTYPTNYLLLLLFTVCTGIMVGFASAAASWQAVMLSAGVTSLTFMALSTYAWKTKSDFTGLGPYLAVAVICLVLFSFAIGLCQLFGAPVRGMMVAYDLAGVLLFSMYIVYDTQVMLGGSHKMALAVDEYAFAALSLYLDIIDLFLFLLDLFAGDRS